MAIKDTLFEKVGITVGANTYLIPVTKKSIKLDPEVRIIKATGKRTPWDSFMGKVEATGSIEFILDENSAPLLDLVNGDGVALTEFSFDDGDNLYSGCKVSDLKITIPTNEELTVSLDFIIQSKGASALSGEAVLSNPFVGRGLTFTGLPDVDAESIDITVSNSLKSLFSLKKTDRLPVHYAEGYQDLKIDFEYIDDPNIDNWASSISKIANGSIAIPSADGTKTLTISLTNLLPTSPTEDADPEDIKRFGLSFTAHTISFSVA